MSLVIVHSHLLNLDGKPSDEYKARLDRSFEMFTKGEIEKILLTGGIATNGVNKAHSYAAVEYLSGKGISNDSLFSETMGALETVGEFAFARKEYDNLLLQPGIKIIHLSSDYHISRMKKISELIWGVRSEEMNFIGVDGFYRDTEAEKRSIDAFHKTFSGVQPGNIEQILQTLWKKYPLYSSHPLNPNLNINS